MEEQFGRHDRLQLLLNKLVFDVGLYLDPATTSRGHPKTSTPSRKNERNGIKILPTIMAVSVALSTN